LELVIRNEGERVLPRTGRLGETSGENGDEKGG